MLPKGLNINAIEIKTQPSLNYKMNLDRETVNGMCDKQEAMKQVIYKILNKRHKVAATFTAHTIFGDIEAESEVTISV